MMLRAPRSAWWCGLVAGIVSAFGVWALGSCFSGRGRVELVGPLVRRVEVPTEGGGMRSVTLWLRAEVRESAVLDVYRERARATVRVGGETFGIDGGALEREVERMVREEAWRLPALRRIEVPRVGRGTEGSTDVVRWHRGGLVRTFALVGATGLSAALLAFVLVAVAARAWRR